jgi:hypothetical protein
VKGAVSAADKGKTLEDLLAWLFPQFDGITVEARNVSTDSQEIDLVLFNDQISPVFKAWSQEILVEAKNWSTPVDAPAVGWFITKLRDRSIKYGILVAKFGITGMARGFGGGQDVITGCLRDGYRPIVLTLAELEALSTHEDFYRLLRAKQSQVLLGQI